MFEGHGKVDKNDEAQKLGESENQQQWKGADQKCELVNKKNTSKYNKATKHHLSGKTIRRVVL